MNKHINLQDIIFILNSRMKILRDLMLLEADPDLFFEKTVDDVNFMDHALDTLLRRIQDNNRIFERNEVLDYLSDLEWDFSQVLGEFLEGGGGISANSFPVVQEQIRLLQAQSTERRRVIGEEQKYTAGPVIEHTVSSDELNELLKDL
jgi:deoxyadenosine/deoxycytidine kinase